MTDPISFNEARANKEDNALLWTPLDCLKALLRDLESGECAAPDGVYVAMVRKGKDKQATSYPYYTAGLTALELRGLLAEHLHNICSAFEK